MQATVSNTNSAKWLRVGAVIGVLALVFWLLGKWNGPTEVSVAPAPVAVSQPAEVEPAVPAQSASLLDELLSKAAALEGMPAIGDLLEAQIEADWGAAVYTNGAAECVYSILDKLGLSNCKASTRKFMETCYQFYSRAHCDNRLDNGPESYSQPAS